MGKLVAIPARQLERGHDFIFIDKYGNFFFEDTDGEYMPINNITYLNDIKSSYGEKRIKNLIKQCDVE